MIEENGLYHVSDYSSYLNRHLVNFPHCSKEKRRDFSLDLAIGNFDYFTPLIYNDSLNAKFVNTIRTGCNFYMKALQDFESNPEIAYLHLITVGEILSQYYEYDNEELLKEDSIKSVIEKMKASLCFEDKDVKKITKRVLSVTRKFIITFNKLVNDKFFKTTKVLNDDWGKLTKRYVSDP